LYLLTNEHKAKLDQLYLDRSVAYEDLDAAKKEIDRWYSRSERTYFFGNGGKELPQHSLFGQSHGDLDAYKDDRAKASEEIQSCKKEIGLIKVQNTILRTKINNVKADRQRMWDQQKKGLNVEKIRNVLVETESQLRNLKAELTKLEVQRGIFFKSARDRNGVPSLEAEIARIGAEKKVFLSSFDEPQAKSCRKLAHRKEWLNTH
jgi:chromosome segregation ATPase